MNYNSGMNKLFSKSSILLKIVKHIICIKMHIPGAVEPFLPYYEDNGVNRPQLDAAFVLESFGIAYARIQPVVHEYLRITALEFRNERKLNIEAQRYIPKLHPAPSIFLGIKDWAFIDNLTENFRKDMNIF